MSHVPSTSNGTATSTAAAVNNAPSSSPLPPPPPPSSPVNSSSCSSASKDASIEVASLFYTGLNEPRPTAIDFSLDGLQFLSCHGDDAIRLIDVGGLAHTETIQCDSFGVHEARFTQSSSVVALAPRHPLDGHLHLLNVETAQVIGELAYLNDLEGELKPEPNTPVYTSVAQCPQSDLLAAVVTTAGRLALFHPLISGALAASAPRSILGSRPVVSFDHAPGGHLFAVGDEERVTVFDRRRLFAAPLATVRNRDVFGEGRKRTRCKGLELSADGTHLLLSSSYGETLLYDWAAQRVHTNYFHDDAKRHFLGSDDALGARFLVPTRADSIIAQATSSMVGGRHLLLYEGYRASNVKKEEEQEEHSGDEEGGQGRQGKALSTTRLGSLLYELQSKDSDVPVALAVNPRYKLLAVAARSVTWWAFTF